MSKTYVSMCLSSALEQLGKLKNAVEKASIAELFLSFPHGTIDYDLGGSDIIKNDILDIMYKIAESEQLSNQKSNYLSHIFYYNPDNKYCFKVRWQKSESDKPVVEFVNFVQCDRINELKAFLNEYIEALCVNKYDVDGYYILYRELVEYAQIIEGKRKLKQYINSHGDQVIESRRELLFKSIDENPLKSALTFRHIEEYPDENEISEFTYDYHESRFKYMHNCILSNWLCNSYSDYDNVYNLVENK